jgi:hypothetical protein
MEGCTLDCEREELLQQIAIKRSTVEELSAGRISLKEATSRFLELDDGWPRIQAHVKSAFAGTSDSEREARCVVLMACNHTSALIARRSLIERLATEFAELFPNASQISPLPRNYELSIADAL